MSLQSEENINRHVIEDVFLTYQYQTPSKMTKFGQVVKRFNGQAGRAVGKLIKFHPFKTLSSIPIGLFLWFFTSNFTQFVFTISSLASVLPILFTLFEAMGIILVIKGILQLKKYSELSHPEKTLEYAILYLILGCLFIMLPQCLETNPIGIAPSHILII